MQAHDLMGTSKVPESRCTSAHGAHQSLLLLQLHLRRLLLLLLLGLQGLQCGFDLGSHLLAINLACQHMPHVQIHGAEQCSSATC